MKNFKNKFMKFISLSLVLTLTFSLNVFAANSASTGQVRLGSGNTGGLVYGYNGISGNGTVGLGVNASTEYQTSGNANSGTRVMVDLVVKSGTKTLYSNTDTKTTGATGTVTASLYSGHFAVSSITATSVHSVSGPVSFSRTLVTSM